ncbi:MAG: beta galactosidase jelly roll domain-containing protein [Alphaproteobacteria bacterium]|nr:beta galactosidase jelly roll domain-containing protein [Alphaproteobacteria bacterium]
MDRRDFIKTTGTAVAGAALGRGARAQTEIDTSERLIFPVNRGWRFSPSVVAGGHDVGFDDSKFDRVVIPHTNRPLPWHGFDDKDYEFVSLYRRRFRLPGHAHGRRIFVDFEGAMTASTVWINGTRLGEYKGGYTPFSFEITPHVKFDSDNVLAVDVDSTERPDIPPFGNQIDYLTFGGIYREVSLRVVPQTFIENVFVRPKDVLTGRPGLDVLCYLEGPAGAGLSLEAVVLDKEKVIGRAVQTVAVAGGPGEPITVTFTPLRGVTLWSLQRPYLYTVRVRLLEGNKVVDELALRTGFRHAEFTDHGFELNGKVLKLRGLDRHQTFPFVGQAMPGRVQRRDAEVLRKELKCNIVRTSHYPQSRHFLDACDELGLLVLEEIPGWQHIGDAAWKDIAVDNVARMIERDWNHPSIILWGVRINESQDDHDFYTRTNALARKLDSTRQTGGIRYLYDSELLEDVFTMNDFGWPLKPPNHPRYLNTEFVGHTYPTKSTDNDAVQREHTIRHARVHDALASNPQYAGGIAWCAFDYNTHFDFGSGDRICYHGVADIFRLPKPAAGFYRSQCEPEEEVVLEPAFHWAAGDEPTHFGVALISSNCDHLKLYSKNGEVWDLLAEVDPDREQFKYLKYPPFSIDLFGAKGWWKWGDLRIDGYIKGRKAISKTYSGRGVDQQFLVQPDDTQLTADGADATRIVLRVTDEFGNVRPFANDAILLKLEGPADLIGDNPFVLIGGVGAVWVRARDTAGTVRLTATHPRFGDKVIDITLLPTSAEAV